VNFVAFKKRLNKAVKYMVISSFAFSLMQVCVKLLEGFPVTELILFRSIVSLLLSLIVVWKVGISPFGNSRKTLFLRGVFGVTALTMFFYTLQKMPIATAITIQYLSPIFTSLFAIWILNEPMKTRQWLFFAVSFLGILVMKGLNDDINTEYVVIGIIAAAFAGLAYNMIRKVKDTDHPVVVVLYFPLVAIPVMGAFSFIYWKTPVGVEWLILVAMGVFTQIAQVYMTKAWQAEAANKVASLKYVGIVFALFFDLALFNIVPPWTTIAGIMLVLLGVVLNVKFKGK
jgi:drug/metabolite transporter (DMT)-like permease